MDTNAHRTRRIAKNTLMLYVRMLFMTCVGLFTSRIILNKLGVDDYGIYNAVSGLVSAFTIANGAVTQTIMRFISYSIGQGDIVKLRRVFSTSIIIQFILSFILFIFIETLGQSFLHNNMIIPEGRISAAVCVLHCCAGMLVFNLLAVPYNADITAHENMSAFAWISMIEGVLKLLVTCALSLSDADSLKLYSILMLAASFVIRSIYVLYCKRHYPETHGKLVFDIALIKEMGSFAGWNFLGSGTFVINTQGVNVLCNLFFGVTVNAARGVVTQVESMVRQLVSGFLTAINPQIIKSYANSDKDYCFGLVNAGVKYSFLVIWIIALPVFFEAETLLRLWLGTVPENAALFLKLSMFGLLADMICNPVLTLVQATSNIRKYYILTGSVSLLAFVLTWSVFKLGFKPWAAYVVFSAVYFTVDVIKVLVARNLCGFPVRKFGHMAIRLVLVAVLTFLTVWSVCFMMQEGWIRLVVVTAVSCIITVVASWAFILTYEEKSFIKSKLLCR